MKKSLQFSLAALAVSVLTACGSGSSEDAADKYVGTWLAKCAAYTGNDGNTYYRKLKRILTKANANQLDAKNSQEGAYSDTVCSKSLTSSVYQYADSQYNIGKTVTVLGAQADEITTTDLTTKATFPGFMTISNGQWYIASYDPAKGQTTIASWSTNSPYTKQ